MNIIISPPVDEPSARVVLGDYKGICLRLETFLEF
jgi:hypothetical protein